MHAPSRWWFGGGLRRKEVRRRDRLKAAVARRPSAPGTAAADEHWQDRYVTGGVVRRSACRCRTRERPTDALRAWCPIAGGGRSWATVVGCLGVIAAAMLDWSGCGFWCR